MMVVKKKETKADSPDTRIHSLMETAKKKLAKCPPGSDELKSQTPEKLIHELNSAPDRVRDTGRRTPEGSVLFPVRWYLYAF